MHAWCCCRPTFYKIYKKKSTEGFQSVPYVISLFSAMIWIYYALLKQNAIFLMTINTFCCVMQTIYIAVYVFYAPKKVRVRIFTNTLLNIFRPCIHIHIQSHVQAQMSRLFYKSRFELELELYCNVLLLNLFSIHIHTYS